MRSAGALTVSSLLRALRVDGAGRLQIGLGALALAAACVLVAGGLGAAGRTEPGQAPQGPIPALKPFKQDIPSAAYKLDMVPIPGSPDGKIKPFWMSATEVTWEAFDVFAYRLDEPEDAPPSDADAKTRPSKPYLPPDRGFGHEGYAAISLTHRAAAGFCEWLSLKSGRKYRLASEDEWEHACRGGSAGSGAGAGASGSGAPAAPAFSFGSDAAALGEHAWFAANSEGTPHPVGKKKPSSLGLFDMHGNVREWVNGRDGKPITKGGSYRDPPEKLTVEARIAQDRTWNATDPQLPKSTWWLSDGPFAGFRIVCEADGDQPAKAPVNPTGPAGGPPRPDTPPAGAPTSTPAPAPTPTPKEPAP